MIRIGFWALLLVMGSTGADMNCSSHRKSSVQFTVTSFLQKSGKRSVSAELLSEAPGPAPVSMFVDHWTTTCDGGESVGINVAIDDPNGPRDPRDEQQEWERLTEKEKTRAEKRPTTTTTPTPTTTPTTTTLPPTTTTIRPDYVVVPGIGRYKIHRTAVQMAEAQNTCISEGAVLMFPNTRAELDAVLRIWRQANLGNQFWVGMTKRGNEWTLLDGQLLKNSAFRVWYALQPSGDGTCSEIIDNSLNDLSCTEHKRYFLCELSL